MTTDKSKFSTYLPEVLEDQLKIWMAERGIRSNSAAVATILSAYFGLERENFQIANFATKKDLEKLVEHVDMIEADLDELEKKVDTLESKWSEK